MDNSSLERSSFQICVHDVALDTVENTAGNHLQRELRWRQASGLRSVDQRGQRYLATRWSDSRPVSRHEALTPDGYHVLSLSLRSGAIRFWCDGSLTFNGLMSAGALHITAPGREVAIECATPCDFIHLYVEAEHLKLRQGEMEVAVDRAAADLNGRLIRDPAVELLTRTLLDENAGGGALYTEAVAEAVLTRLLLLAQAPEPSRGLPLWRLRRVQNLISSRLAESLTLSDMAAEAGLSRMHFAAQFKLATGSTPHEFLVRRRVEAAKPLLEGTDTPLAQVALSVGFQAQAHFNTVFKRLTGETPGGWRRNRRQDAREQTGLTLLPGRRTAEHGEQLGV